LFNLRFWQGAECQIASGSAAKLCQAKSDLILFLDPDRTIIIEQNILRAVNTLNTHYVRVLASNAEVMS
jgi:hypothetical protein